MKQKSTKITKLSFIIAGALLILISSRMKFATSAFIGNPLLPKFPATTYYATEVPVWQASVIGAGILFLLSYFRNSLFFKISYYIALTITLFLTTVFAMTFSRDTEYYSNNMEYGFYVEQTGFALMLLGTLIYLHRPITKERNIELLDSEV